MGAECDGKPLDVISNRLLVVSNVLLHSVARLYIYIVQVLRTAQYGCNCRGIGGNGGCGEFDILEAIIGNPYSDMLFTHVYDFKGTGSPGQSKYFKRPLVSDVNTHNTHKLISPLNLDQPLRKSNRPTDRPI